MEIQNTSEAQTKKKKRGELMEKPSPLNSDLQKFEEVILFLCGKKWNL